MLERRSRAAATHIENGGTPRVETLRATVEAQHRHIRELEKQIASLQTIMRQVARKLEAAAE